MRARTLCVLCFAAAVAACARGQDRSKKTVVRPNYLLDVPYIAQSILEDTTGTPEAQHMVLLSPKLMDSVATFYRRELASGGWQLIGDVGDTTHVTLYLERGGRPLWIQIEAQGPDSRVSLTAAGANEAAAAGAARR